jgi:hypothetical protein
LPRLILQPSVNSTRIFLRFFARAPCPFNVITKNFFGVYFLEINPPAFSFRWKSLRGWDFLGHSSLLFRASLGGNPSMDGIF